MGSNTDPPGVACVPYPRTRVNNHNDMAESDRPREPYAERRLVCASARARVVGGQSREATPVPGEVRRCV